MGKKKPSLSLDFDGVLHDYDGTWLGAGIVIGKPVLGAFEFIGRCIPHFTIYIYSARSREAVGRDAMLDWCQTQMVDELEHWFRSRFIPSWADCIRVQKRRLEDALENEPEAWDNFAADYIESFIAKLNFPDSKPAAFVGLDDRVLTFDGNWPKVDELKNFRPWNR